MRLEGRYSLEQVVGHVPLAQEVRVEDSSGKPLREDGDHSVDAGGRGGSDRMESVFVRRFPSPISQVN